MLLARVPRVFPLCPTSGLDPRLDAEVRRCDDGDGEQQTMAESSGPSRPIASATPSPQQSTVIASATPSPQQSTVIASATPSPQQSTVRRPIVNLHFHKAGGTSMHLAFVKAGLVSNGNSGYKSNGNCAWLMNLFQTEDGVTAADLLSGFACSGDSVCAVERPQFWPRPETFHRIRAEFPGAFSTCLREPWSRFLSNFARDLAVCIEKHGDDACAGMTIESWAEPGGTPFSAPNLYTGMLNGYGTWHGQMNAGKSWSGAELEERHLLAAKEVCHSNRQ